MRRARFLLWDGLPLMEGGAWTAIAIKAQLPLGSSLLQTIDASSSAEASPWSRVWPDLAVAALVVVGVWAVSKLRSLERRRVAHESLVRALMISQENERMRITAELHDSLGQNLLMIKNRVLLALQEPHAEQNMVTQLEEIAQVTTQSIEEIRLIARNLRPYQLDRLGLSKAMRAMVKQTAQSSRMDITGDIQLEEERFPREVEINLYRIMQEGLNNVVKHSGAAQARVKFHRTDNHGYAMIIEDNGRGFDLDAVLRDHEHRGGLGVSTMQERARMLHGHLKFVSRPGHGTTLLLTIPDLRKNHGA